jgi:hypothetical protein
MTLGWGLETLALAERMAAVLEAAESALRVEQAAHGLDVWDERALQAELARGLATHYDVTREVHYPSSLGSKLSHRERCDLVLSGSDRIFKGTDCVPSRCGRSETPSWGTIDGIVEVLAFAMREP